MAHKKHTWTDDEVITKELMNALETDLTALGDKYTLPAAKTSTLGGVKQMSNVEDASTDTGTDLKDKINEILAALKTAGIMSTT